MVRKNIAVVAGGNSSEYSVSMKSGRNIIGWIDPSLYNAFLVEIKGSRWNVRLENNQTVDIDKNDFSFSYQGHKTKFDCAVLAIHGTPGEDGILQSYFELVGVPYNTCDVFVSSITFNKHACKVLLKEHSIRMAKDVLLFTDSKGDLALIEKNIGFPCFVKPNASGSSCGVSRVNSSAELATGIKAAFAEGDSIIVEAALSGIEISHAVAVLGGNEFVFPITEIVTSGSFFDYHAKYDGDKSEEITPARLSERITIKCQATSMQIYRALGCRGVVRIDYIIQDGEPYFLEINTVPGMSSQSIVPKQIIAMGMTVADFYTLMIEDAIASVGGAPVHPPLTNGATSEDCYPEQIQIASNQ